MWNIVFYNDDHTPMDFVVFVLTKVFHRSTEDALALTFAVHTQGKGIAGTYTFEVAEQKQCNVLLMAKIEEHPLRIQVERARRLAGNPSRHAARWSETPRLPGKLSVRQLLLGRR